MGYRKSPAQKCCFLLPCAAESAAVSSYYSNRDHRPRLPPTPLVFSRLFQSAAPLNTGASTAALHLLLSQSRSEERASEWADLCSTATTSESLQCCCCGWSMTFCSPICIQLPNHLNRAVPPEWKSFWLLGFLWHFAASLSQEAVASHYTCISNSEFINHLELTRTQTAYMCHEITMRIYYFLTFLYLR